MVASLEQKLTNQAASFQGEISKIVLQLQGNEEKYQQAARP